MKDRYKSSFDIPSIKGGSKIKKKKGNPIVQPGSSLTDRNNILLDSSAQPRVSKFQREKQKRSPIKNAKVNRKDRMASRRTDTLDSIASLTSKRQQKKNRAVDLPHGFEFHDCLENHDSDGSVQSQPLSQPLSQEFRKSPVIELDNNDFQIEQHDDKSLEMAKQVMTQILPRNKMNEPIPRKNKLYESFLPPRYTTDQGNNHSTGLGLAFQKVNTIPKQRSNVMEEIDDSSNEDRTWTARSNKKRNSTYSKRDKQKKELEWMQKRDQRERYGTDYDDGYTDDFDKKDLGVQQPQPQLPLKKGRRKRARSQSALKGKDNDYLKDDDDWIHHGDRNLQNKELEQKQLLQASKEKCIKLGKTVGQTVKKTMDSATRALSFKTPSKRYKKSSSHFLDEDTPSTAGSPPTSNWGLGPRRSTRSSARKSRLKVENEVIELSSDEESDEDMPTPQNLSNCDKDAAIAASLNRELNHSSRNTSRRLEQEEQEEYEIESKRISPRTRSRDSKCFVECTRIAIGNQVYFENMEMSYVPNQQNQQLFELDLNYGIKLRIDAEDIEEIHYYMPGRHELGIDCNNDGESDESEEQTTGNENDFNESADSSDDEDDLKKYMNAQKKRIIIDDDEEEEMEEEQEQSQKVVSSDTSGEVTSEMLQVEKDLDIQGEDKHSNNNVIALDDDDDDDALVNDSSQHTDVNESQVDSQKSVQVVDKNQTRKETLCVDDSSDDEGLDTSKNVPVENRKLSHDSSDSSVLVEHGTLPQSTANVDYTMKSHQDEAANVSRLGSPELEDIIQNHPVREKENENELNASNPDDHLQDIAMHFEENLEAAKSSTKEELADDKSMESNDNVETTSLTVNPDQVIQEPTEEAEDDIRSHFYLILRAKPSKENGLTSFTSKQYYRSMPKSTPTKSTQLAKRYIVIESSNQTDFEGLITFLKRIETIGMFFTSNNMLKHNNLDEAIVSLLNFKKPMQPICEEHETALVFPSSLLETELDFVSSNLIEPNGKLGQNLASMFSNVAIKEKAPNGKQKNHIITIRGEDYDRLAPGEFLNDTLIDFWISWLIYRMGNVSDRVHVFTTQFYTKLENEGVESVMSWTAKKNIDIFEKKYVFVPVNKDIHWSLLVIVNPGNIVSDDDDEAWNKNMEHPYILFMDSLRAHKKSKLQKNLHKWLNAEAARLRKFDQMNPYKHVACPVEIASVPTQDNCWDCGVFVCRYAFAMLHLLDTRIECKLEDWRDAKFRKDVIKQNITETEAFNFEMDDIARLREEMAILIQDLHRIYKQKMEEKKTKKKAKKQQIQMQQENNRIEN